MNRSMHRYLREVISLAAILTALLVGGSIALAVVTPDAAAPHQEELFSKASPAVRAVMAVQDRHTDFLLGQPGVVGTATGLGEDGRPAILVLVRSFEAGRRAVIPASLEGVPVIVLISGEIKALKGPATRPQVDPTARFDRPVPIGVSTGHPDITAGTIGARVSDGSSVYALSNNHVYADENSATIGDNVLQPGAYDGGINPADAIGDLVDFEPICFNASQAKCSDGGYNDAGDNTIDAAVALSSAAQLGNATPADGYGAPRSATAAPAINLNVMKYGRTTGLTKGRITGIHATVNVGYDSGVATFVDQIIIQPGSFSAGGDSGSLIVVQKGSGARQPVGLLFAGSVFMTIANPIGPVLDRFGVAVDGD